MLLEEEKGKFYIWGIVNATPDSFSDGVPGAGSEYFIARGLSLVADGAHVLDVGGESTRPGWKEISVGEELDRVLPVIEGLRKNCSVPISIDTRRSAVAKAALAAGACIANDIFGLQGDSAMAKEVANRAKKVVVMYQRQQFLRNENVIDDMITFWNKSICIATSAGIPVENLILDVGLGVGFQKTVEQNFYILRNLSKLHSHFPSCAFLLGASRKSFLEKLVGPMQPRERDLASAAVARHALAQGIRHFRVHNVALTKQILRGEDLSKVRAAMACLCE